MSAMRELFPRHAPPPRGLARLRDAIRIRARRRRRRRLAAVGAIVTAIGLRLLAAPMTEPSTAPSAAMFDVGAHPALAVALGDAALPPVSLRNGGALRPIATAQRDVVYFELAR